MDHIPSKLAALMVLSISPTVAFAYLDPGTGSALIQGLIAAIAAIGVSIKLFWHRLVAFFAGSRDEEGEEVDQEGPTQQ